MLKRIAIALIGAAFVVSGLGAPSAQAAPAIDTRVGKVVAKKTPPRLLPDGTVAEVGKLNLPDKLITDGKNGALARRVPTKATKAGKTTAVASSMMVGPVFRYAGGIENNITADGTYSTVRIHKPALDIYHYHTLAEITAQRDTPVSGGGTTRQIVEIGWNVDRVVNGNDDPHLFVFNWVNNTPGCYNGCGYVDVGSNPMDAGDSLSSLIGTAKKFGIQYVSGDWWLAYDNSWIGYFPGTEWSAASPAATFTTLQYTQQFGEAVVSDDGLECGTEMGSGTHAQIGGVAQSASAYFTTGGYVNGPASMNLSTYVASPTHSGFSVYQVSGRTIRYGGPGETGTPPC